MLIVPDINTCVLFYVFYCWNTVYVRVMLGLNVYFAIITSKNLQKSSAIQNI